MLGVDPRADSATIKAAYETIAKKYHPDNLETGDAEKLEAVSIAFEVLSDPTLRASFDKLKGITAEEDQRFTGGDLFEALKKSADLRGTILCILYDRRRIKPFSPGISLRQVESMLHVTNDGLNFALWYLKQRSLVISDDKSNLQITVEGMDFLESHPPEPARILAFFKPNAVVPAQQPAEASGGRGAVLKALNRSISAKI